MKKYKLYIKILVIFLVFFPFRLFAAGEDNIPIDGGLSLLLAAGMGYGGYKIVKEQKKSNAKK